MKHKFFVKATVGIGKSTPTGYEDEFEETDIIEAENGYEALETFFDRLRDAYPDCDIDDDWFREL